MLKPKLLTSSFFSFPTQVGSKRKYFLNHSVVKNGRLKRIHNDLWPPSLIGRGGRIWFTVRHVLPKSSICKTVLSRQTSVFFPCRATEAMVCNVTRYFSPNGNRSAILWACFGKLDKEPSHLVSLRQAACLIIRTHFRSCRSAKQVKYSRINVVWYCLRSKAHRFIVLLSETNKQDENFISAATFLPKYEKIHVAQPARNTARGVLMASTALEIV